MMKFFNLSATSKALLTAGVLSLAVSGCSGDDGTNGEDGKPGPVGTPIGEVSNVIADITSASVSEDGFLTVNFNLSDANGAAVFGMQQTDIGALSFGRVGAATEITPPAEGEEPSTRQIWLSYFNKDKGDGHFTGSSYFNGASSECTDCFTDNEDGSYSITIDKAIDTLGKYDYKADATSGIYMAVKAKNNAETTMVDNAFYYWQPAADIAADKPLQILANENCQTCHRPGQDGALAMHGSKHQTEEACSFCHTDYNSYMKEDADGNAYEYDGSIKAMAHNIHNTSAFQDEEKDEDGNVIQAAGIYPQLASNCQTCHAPDDSLNLTDAWKADQDAATCTSCHTTAPGWHGEEGGDYDEAHQVCSNCHSADGYARGAERAHYTENTNAQAAETKVTFNSMTYSAATETIVANMTVTHGDDTITLAQIDPSPYVWGGYTSAIVFNGVVDDDFVVNYQKVGFDKFAKGANGSIDVTFTDAEFKVAEVMGTEGVKAAFSSQLHVCFSSKGVVEDCKVEEDGTVSNSGPYAVSDTAYFNVDGTVVTESPRVQHAEMVACQQCHTTDIKHRFSNDMDGCASCHNGTRDKKGTGSSNLAYIVHSKHYLSDSSGDLFFKKTECQACHGEDGYSLSKIAGDAAPVAFGKENLGKDADGKDIWGEQLVVSPQTAACVSCHQAPYGLNDATASHIQGMGGILVQEGAELTTLGVPASDYELLNVQETCSTCHKDDAILEAHSNWVLPRS